LPETWRSAGSTEADLKAICLTAAGRALTFISRKAEAFGLRLMQVMAAGACRW